MTEAELACAQLDDIALEHKIDQCFDEMMKAQNPADERRWCDQMTSYVKQRSPERVQAMELEMGLAR